MNNKTPNQTSLRPIILFFLLLLIAIFFNLFTVLYFQNLQKSDSKIVDVAGRNRMLSQRIALLAKQKQSGNQEISEELLSLIEQHDTSLRILKNGGQIENTSQIAPVAPEQVLKDIQTAELLWSQYKSQAEIIARQQTYVNGQTNPEFQAAILFIENNADEMLDRNNTIVLSFVANNKHKTNVFHFSMIALSVIYVILLIICYWFTTRIARDLKTQIQTSSKFYDELQKNESLLKSKSKKLENQQKAMLNLLEDIDEERKQSKQQAQNLKKFQQAVENASDQIVITDQKGTVIYANPSVKITTGYSVEETIGKKAGELWGGKMDRSFYQEMWKKISEKKEFFSAEVTNTRKDGTEYIADLQIAPIIDDKGQIIFFVGIERDITKAKEIDKMKTEFISLASHQLRTPLTSIKWFLEMLLTGDMGELTNDQREGVDNAFKSNERMIELVDSLLNISRIESGRILVEPEPTDIKKLVESVISEVKVKAENKKQTIIFSIKDGLEPINLDPKLTRHLYTNLLTNAIKYSPPETDITVVVSKDEENIISQISDQGFGIPQEQQGRMFEKFFRASNIIKKVTDGNGLGMYLVKSVVESSGGKIWFESKENEGTTFWFTLPLSGVKAKDGEVTLN